MAGSFGMGPLVLGVDSSTSACKAIAWPVEGELAGTPVAEGRASFPLHSPEPGGWEQNAEDWWRALGEACRQLVERLGSDSARVAALCVTHQRETVVVTDPQGNPLLPALVWMDRRATAQVEQAKQTLGANAIHQLSGKPPCTTPSLYKLRYLFDRHPGLNANCHISDVHAFLVRRLLGQHVTSLASADPMGLLDLAKGAYAPPLLDFLGVGEHQLPRLVPPGMRLGGLTPSAAAHIGLKPGLPLVAGAGDGQAAGLGAGVQAPGEAYLNLGTALVSGVLSLSYRTDLAYRTLYSAAPACDYRGGAAPSYFLETDLLGGTFTFDWLVERLLTSADKHAQLESLGARASALPPGAEGLLLVPYLNGVMNPYWDDQASGMLVGLRGRHGPEHVYRAIVEGLALEQHLQSRGVEASAGRIHTLVTLGGLSQSAWVRQVFADVLNKPIVSAGTTEATCLGAGVLGACGVELFDAGTAAVSAMTRRGAVTAPGDHAAFYAELFEIYATLYPSLREPLARLAALTP